jgi:hypothetical protein
MTQQLGNIIWKNPTVPQGNKTAYQASLSCPKPFLVNKFLQGNIFLNSLLKLSEYTKLFPYGYHPPLDINMTHWASRSAPTLPLPHSGSTFNQPFYLIYNKF